jgi:hypothetical protein
MRARSAIASVGEGLIWLAARWVNSLAAMRGPSEVRVYGLSPSAIGAAKRSGAATSAFPPKAQTLP